MDVDTRKIVREGEELRSLLIGEGWGIATKLLDEMMTTLESVTTIPDELTVEQTAIEAISRKRSIVLISSWRHALNAKVAQYEAYISVERNPVETVEPIMINRE